MFDLLLQVLLLTTPVQSAPTSNDVNLCFGPYALCSAALCYPIPNNSTHVTCNCEGPFNGENVGRSSCLARAGSLTSTYSIPQGFSNNILPQEHYFECTGSNAGPWAACSDAPCSTVTGTVVCTCPLQTGENLWYGEVCPTDEAEKNAFCAQLRSASSLPNATSTQSTSQELKTQFEAAGILFVGNPEAVTACNESEASST